MTTAILSTMKYSNEIEIGLPVGRVIELFDNPDNLGKWMKGFVRFEHISGDPGQPGARSKLIFRQGGREIEMIETVTVRNLPEEFSGTYELKGTWNSVRNMFIDLGNGRTKYISESEFKFDGLMMQIMAKLMPGAFRKQSFKFMKAFREFAEAQGG